MSYFHMKKPPLAAPHTIIGAIVQKVSDSERSESALFAQGEYRAKG
ncbi:hypothetical protein L1077_27200 [Pseudoalteromonas luteoviolacea]|nr:hypothetical protein [Pseudoalteromonas luteoviolacea]MCF6443112.1 hypothetical protein [Pseudoalteromonas luteoviolacea]